jgi:hypothetical protein
MLSSLNFDKFHESGQKKRGLFLKKTETVIKQVLICKKLSSSIRTLTVGFGISPNLLDPY